MQKIKLKIYIKKNTKQKICNYCGVSEVTVADDIITTVDFIDFKEKYCGYYTTIVTNASDNNENIKHTVKIPFDCVHFLRFSGLKDKNGFDIYEGDIILSKYWDDRIDKCVKRKAKIIFHNGYFGVDDGKYWKPVLINIIDDTWTIEVVGNIHRNPEVKLMG